MFSLRILQVTMDMLLHARIKYRKVSVCNAVKSPLKEGECSISLFVACYKSGILAEV